MATALWKCAIFFAVVITGTTAIPVSDRDELLAYYYYRLNALIMNLENDSPWMGYEQQVKALPPPTAGIVRIAALPVGQGDCTIIQCPKGNIIILDCGSSSSSQGIDASGVVAYLGAQIKNVNTIVISHGDYDHYGYLPSIITKPATSGVQNIVYGGSINDYAAIGNWLKQFPKGTVQAVASENQCYGASCTTPKGLDFCADTNVKFDILGANYNGISKNEKSIVLKLQHKKWSMTFSGDLEGAAETNLVKYYTGTTTLLSDYYKLAHHGSDNSANRQGILNAVNPYVAIASNAYDYGNLRHPRCNTIDNLLKIPSGRLKKVSPHRLDCGTSTGMTINKNFAYAVYATAPYPGYDLYIEIESDGKPG